MDDEEFKSEKLSLISRLLKKKKRMVEYSKELWMQIEKEEFQFKKNELLANLVKDLQKDEILQFFVVIQNCDLWLHLYLNYCLFFRNIFRSTLPIDGSYRSELSTRMQRKMKICLPPLPRIFWKLHRERSV